ncbi:ATP-binding protein [Paenibacillus sp. TRM 82003]|nr:ATP-binding protein [Paenibacillus sp. TRM 82003]
MGIGRRIDPGESAAAAEALAADLSLNRAKEAAPAATATKEKASPASFIAQAPKYRFEDVILPAHTLEAIKNALAVKDKSDLVFEKWGLHKTHKHSRKIGINLYGPPGTGKTMAAHAIAHEFKKKLMVINYADIESKFVGETPKNLTEAFRLAVDTDSILFFDEADAILSRRVTNMNNATDTSVNQTRSVMLTLLNDYQGVILFATNYISNFDPAFMRRILAHIAFELPDREGRERLLRKLIPPEMPNTIRVGELAERFEGVSGSDISNAVLTAAFRAARTEELSVRHEYVAEALESIKQSQRANEGGTSKVTVETRQVSEDYVKQQLGY